MGDDIYEREHWAECQMNSLLKDRERLRWLNEHPLAVRYSGTQEGVIGFWIVVSSGEPFDELSNAIDSAKDQ